MTTKRGGVAAFVMAVLLAISAFVAGPAWAQQGAPVNPTAKSVKEQQLLDALKPGGTVQGRISIPDEKAGTLMQPAGRDYQTWKRETLSRLSAIVIVGMLAVLVAFFLFRGKIKVDSGLSGHTITRFGGVDRFVHWLTAVTFLVLAVSGLNLVFGRALLLPIIGENAFGSLSMVLKLAHNYLAFPFMLGLALMFLIWVKDNLPSKLDAAWFAAGGGLLGKGHPPAARFNGGQKLIFWSVIIGGALLSVSGWHMLFPFAEGPSIAEQTWWQWVHGIVAVVLFAVMLAHIYIGSIGMEGAFDAMGSGEVDLNWAKEHHSLWVEQKLSTPVGGAKMMPAE